MYRQINVHLDDWKYQCILWRIDPKDPIGIFGLTTLTYGIGPSAFLASRPVKQLARDNKEKYPLGAIVLEEEEYMDDTLSGGHTPEEDKAKMQQTIELCKVSGLNLRKCLASTPQLLKDMPGEKLAKNSMNFFSSDIISPVLGLE